MKVLSLQKYVAQLERRSAVAAGGPVGAYHKRKYSGNHPGYKRSRLQDQQAN